MPLQCGNGAPWGRAGKLVLLRSMLSGQALVMAGCSDSRLTFLNPQGAIAAQQRTHFAEIIAIVAIVLVPVLVGVPWMVWRNRYGRPRTPYRPNWDFSWPLEVAIWGSPTAVVVVLIALLISNTLPLDPYRPIESQVPALHVQVIGYDWKWLFIYPDFHVASIGEMVFPADRPVTFQITSATVMQSLFIPALGSQIYAMSGMQTRLNLVADKPGTFMGENTQYNGDGFYQQKFLARAVTDTAFDDWIATARTQGIPFTGPVADMLTRRSTVAGMRRDLGLAAEVPAQSRISFRDVPAGFFSDLIHRYSAMPPARQPMSAPTGAKVAP